MYETAEQLCNLQMGHVLFMDIVDYTRLGSAGQTRCVTELQGLVRQTCAFCHASAARELLSLPAGDGMALVFLRSPIGPAHCAVELSRAVRNHPELRLRMGIHSGLVQLIEDINGQRNAAGHALNFAQRVMSCGDAHHILISESAAELLAQADVWRNEVCDLGLCTVKHGERLHLFNLTGPGFGNPEVPSRLLMREMANGAPTHNGRTHSQEPAPPARVVPPMGAPPPEADGGAVPLGSPFYVVRGADADLEHALKRRDSIILVKGARQMGKTSLLVRGLRQARQAGCAVALTDFQKLSHSDLQDPAAFFPAVADLLADDLELDSPPAESWNPRRSPGVNFERFLRRQVLGTNERVLVWGVDEVDRLFTCPFGSEVFGLFRSWHNERAFDPEGPWARFTMVIAYATEAHLFITDINQSPFNVGTRLALADFTFDQVQDLNARHGAPLRTDAEVARFYRLVGGQPFLIRTGLHHMVTCGYDVATFELEAVRDEGLFGDHLRRMLVLLSREAHLTTALHAVLRGRPCPDAESFYRLRSSGIIAGENPAEAHPRCQLYAIYLERHLR